MDLHFGQKVMAHPVPDYHEMNLKPSVLVSSRMISFGNGTKLLLTKSLTSQAIVTAVIHDRIESTGEHKPIDFGFGLCKL